MQEQHNREENTDQETVEVSDFEAQYQEAKELDIHVPGWVNPRHHNLYKFAYNQVKKDPGCQGMPSSSRTTLIRRLMNLYVNKILENSSGKVG